MIVFPEAVEDCPGANALIAEFLKQDVADAELPTGGYDFSAHADRFPPWPWLQRRSECDLVLRELELMVLDSFEHYLGVLHEYVLYKSVDEWLELERQAAEEAEDELHAQERDERADRLESLLEDGFPDLDFLNPALMAKIAFESSELRQELDTDVERYLPLMPADVRRDVEQALAKTSASPEGRTEPPTGP